MVISRLRVMPPAVNRIKTDRARQGFPGPKGQTGDTGNAATVEVGTVSSVPFGESARVENVGTPHAAVFEFDLVTGEKGDAATVAIGTVSQVAFPGPPTVQNVGTDKDAVFNFGLVTGQKGDTGNAATVQVGTTQTLAPGSNATVTNSGTQHAAVLNFAIPQGQKGDQGDVSTAQLQAALAALVQPLRPRITLQPVATSGSVGDSRTLQCTAATIENTDLTVAYRWRVSNDLGATWTPLLNATLPSLQLSPLLKSQEALYRCDVTNAFGTRASVSVPLTVDGSIRHLYGVNDRGIAWDLDRMDHLWQAANGQTPVAAYGDPVGLMLTRERGGLDNLGPQLAAAPTTPVTVYREGANPQTGWQDSGITLVPGRTYEIRTTLTANTGTVGCTFRNVTWVQGPQTYAGNLPLGEVVRYATVATFTGPMQLLGDNSVCKMTFSGFSIREVPGIHLIQPTSSRRPTYARRPKSGIRNFTYPSVGIGSYTSGAIHSVLPVTAIGGQLDRFGGNEAVRLTWNGTNRRFGLPASTMSNFPANGLARTFTLSLWARSANGSNHSINLVIRDQPTTTFPSASRTVTNEWQRLTFTASVPSTHNAISWHLDASGNQDILVHDYQFEESSAVTIYQRTGNRFDVTESGQPSINYLWLDGIDDCMRSGSAIDFSNSDEMTVSVSARRTGGTSPGYIVELGVGGGNGFFALGKPWGSNDIAVRSVGTVIATGVTASVYPATDVRLLTAQTKISSDQITLRVNGSQVMSQSSDQGTGNYSNAVLNIGSRNQTTSFFVGHINSGFIINRLLNPLILADYERHWVASKAGIDLP